MKPSVFAPNSDLTAIAYGRVDGVVGVNALGKSGEQRMLVPPLTLHKGAITQVGFSPDDQQVCTASRDGIATALNIEQCQGQQFRGHQAPVNSIALSARNTAITGSNDFTARIWNVMGGKELHNIKCPDIVKRVGMSPRGETAAAAYGAKILIIDAGDGKTLHEIPADHPIAELVYSRDGKMLAGGTDEGKVSIWDLSRAGDTIRVPCMHVFQQRAAISALAFRRDNAVLAVGDRGGEANRYDLEKGTSAPIAIPGRDPEEIMAIGFNAAGESLVFFKARTS